uniref:Uncharacterized protein n=1 Tax=Cacopsylla melanoneura TaxID=428564 RepID=A0A8D9AN30_9HEMI
MSSSEIPSLIIPCLVRLGLVSWFFILIFVAHISSIGGFLFYLNFPPLKLLDKKSCWNFICYGSLLVRDIPDVLFTFYISTNQIIPHEFSAKTEKYANPPLRSSDIVFC